MLTHKFTQCKKVIIVDVCLTSFSFNQSWQLQSRNKMLMCYKYIKTTISLTKSARVVENYNNKLRINWILTIRHAFSMETNHCVVILLDLFSAELILPMSSRNTKRKHKLPVSVCYQKLRSWSMSSYYRFQANRSPCGLLCSSNDSIDVSKSKSFNELY